MKQSALILYVKTGCPWCAIAEEYLEGTASSMSARRPPGPRGLRRNEASFRPDLRSHSCQREKVLPDFGPEELEQFLRDSAPALRGPKLSSADPAGEFLPSARATTLGWFSAYVFGAGQLRTDGAATDRPLRPSSVSPWQRRRHDHLKLCGYRHQRTDAR